MIRVAAVPPAPTKRAGRLGLGPALALLCAVACQANPDAEQQGLDAAIEILHPIIEAECAWRFSCCDAGERTWTMGPVVDGVDACVEQVFGNLAAGGTHPILAESPAGALLEFAQQLNAGNLRARPEAIEACAAVLRARVCNAYVDPTLPTFCQPGEVSLNQPCAVEKIFEGLSPPGAPCIPSGLDTCADGICVGGFEHGTCSQAAAFDEPCTQDAHCRVGLYCDPLEGRCAVGSQLGQNCAFVDPADPFPGSELIKCAPQLECDPIKARCVAPCSEGAQCSAESQCPDGLVCAVDRCRPPGQPGDECDSPTDCESRRCDSLTAICLPVREIGELCTFSSDCESQWCNQDNLCQQPLMPGEECELGVSEACEDGWCRFDIDTQLATCEGFVGAGEACDEIQLCSDPETQLFCIEDRCEPYPFEIGVTCSSDFECASGLCFEMMCETGAPAGTECNGLGSTIDCAAGLSCERIDGAAIGVCAPLQNAGAACEDDNACWGSCTVRWATRMCSADYPSLSEQVFCDGP